MMTGNMVPKVSRGQLAELCLRSVNCCQTGPTLAPHKVACKPGASLTPVCASETQLSKRPPINCLHNDDYGFYPCLLITLPVGKSERPHSLSVNHTQHPQVGSLFCCCWNTVVKLGINKEGYYLYIRCSISEVKRYYRHCF